MGTEVVALPTGGEDQEEGEIIDVEAYENNDFMELESISSEEEENLRDRIRELETRNKELEKLAAMAKEERRTYNYDNTDFVTISSEEEFFEPKFPQKFEIRMLKKSNGMNRGKNRRTNLRYKSPNFTLHHQELKRRRRSLSPEHYRPKSDRRVERTYEHHRGRERKKKKKRNLRRQSDKSESESENEKYVRSQLNAALNRETRVSEAHIENPLMRKLRLRPGSANKENEQKTSNNDKNVSEDEEDDELIALRLQALKSKQEVKELLTEKNESTPLPDLKSDDLDQEELELRMIALKSAIVKKAVARKMKQNEKPYSPTDGLEWTPASPENPYASSESNMQISPVTSPTLDDAVLQPIDMEIATPENMSNSPTFYSFDEKSHVTQMQDFSNAWAPIIPMPTVLMPIPVMYTNQIPVPIVPKTTKNGVPLEILSQQVRDEVTNCRSNTQSPCFQDFNSNLRPRSRSLDSLQPNISTNVEVRTEETPKDTEDDEEQALRTLLLAKLSSPNRPPKKNVPLTIKSVDSKVAQGEKELIQIEDNLKKAANRYKELSEHEEEIIEASLDKILSRELKDDVPKNQEKPMINFKDVVQRLKLSQAKDKLSKMSEEELPKVEKTPENAPEMAPNVEVPVVSESKNPEQNLVKEVSSPKISNVVPADIISPKVSNAIKNPPLTTQIKAINHLKPKQITQAMSSINSATLQKPKPSVLTTKPTPVIMKRKLKTNSSIINVPFQHKSLVPKSSSPLNNIPTSSKTILSLENVIKPVPKVIIRLGQSSTEDSDTDSDDNCTMQPTNESAIGSPSHITEFNGNGSAESPKSVGSSDKQTLVKIDSTFESKLDEFLKQARAKTENTIEVKKTKVAVSVQKTPSAVRHLPISSQIEYKKLLAKMQLLEKQKQARLKVGQLKSKVNVEPNGNIKVTVDNSSAKSTAPSTTTENNVVRPKTISESSENFESRISKMTEDQRDKTLEKYETLYNDFSHQFVTQLSHFMETITETTVEKRKQIKLEMEAEELRAKLAAVEAKLSQQREKVCKIYPKISSEHKKILESRNKYIKMGKCCVKLGQFVRGVDYQFKNEAKDKIFEKLKQLPTKTKQLKNAKEEYLEELSKEKTESANVYRSVLDCMTTSSSVGTNHDGVLCPFDLSGRCSDKECKYVHIS